MNNYQKKLLKEHQDFVKDIITAIIEDEKDTQIALEASKSGTKVRINKVGNDLYHLATEDNSYVFSSAISNPESLIRMCEENGWTIVNFEGIIDFFDDECSK